MSNECAGMRPRFRALTAIVIGVLACILFLPGVDESPVFSDAAMYVNLARSLQQGRGYVSVWIAGEPPHIKFPPLLPLLMVPLVAFFGVNTLMLKFAVAGCGATGLAVMFYVMARRHAGLSLCAVLGTALSPHIRYLASQVLSEMPFILLAALFFWAFPRGKDRIVSPARLIATGILLAAIVMTRLAGIALVIAVILHLMSQKQTPRATKGQILVILAPALIFLICWVHRLSIMSTAHEGYLSYLVNFFEPGGRLFAAQLTEMWVRNIYAAIIYAIPEMVTGWRLYGPGIGALVVSFLTMAGFYASARKQYSLMETYAACWVGIVLCWPDTHISGVRFLAPLTPLLLYYCGVGIMNIMRVINPGQQQRVATGFLLIIVLSQALSGIVSFPNDEQRDMARIKPSFDAAMQWLRDYTPGDGVLLPNPGLAAAVYLYSGRKTVLIAHADFPDVSPTLRDVEALAKKTRVDYGVVVRISPETAVSRALDKEFSESFPVSFENEMVTVYDMRWKQGEGNGC